MKKNQKIKYLTDTLAALQRGINALMAREKTQDVVIGKLREDSESLKIARATLSEIRQILNSNLDDKGKVDSINRLLLPF